MDPATLIGFVISLAALLIFMVMEGADVIFTAKGGEITFKAKEIYVFGGSNIKINCT